MPAYLYPGVYIEEVPSGARPIEGVATSVAVFLGYAVKGPMDEATMVTSWQDYQETFGGIRSEEITDGISGNVPVGDPMGCSVYNFFLNGGAKAYIVRLASNTAAAVGYASLEDADSNFHLVKFEANSDGLWGNDLVIQIEAAADHSKRTVRIGAMVDGEFEAQEIYKDLNLNAESSDYLINKINDSSELVNTSILEGEADLPIVATSLSADAIKANLEAETLNLTTLNSKSFHLTLNDGDSATSISVDFAADAFGEDTKFAPEALTSKLTELVGDADFSAAYDDDDKLKLSYAPGSMEVSLVVTPADVDDAAALLTLGVDAGGTEGSEPEELVNLLANTSENGDTTTVGFASGDDGDVANSESYQAAFATLVKIRGINIICLPGQWWDEQDTSVIDLAISHCEAMKNRMVIIDPPPTTELETETDFNDSGMDAITSTYSAVYYPWARMVNPHYDADTNPGAARQLLVAPSGFAAGMWAKIDGSRGVWKAPAGVETNLLGISALQYTVDNAEQAELNPVGVNAIRRLTGYGNVIWGSRTRATKAKPEWRYIPVRRTAIYIEESIYNGIQWAVFEPNDHRLWSSLRLNIESFMDGLFQAGAFQGQTASSAYFVQCGLGQTMKQNDIDAGRVIVDVGFAPLKPAEFVIIRIKQKVGES